MINFYVILCSHLNQMILSVFSHTAEYQMICFLTVLENKDKIPIFKHRCPVSFFNKNICLQNYGYFQLYMASGKQLQVQI